MTQQYTQDQLNAILQTGAQNSAEPEKVERNPVTQRITDGPDGRDDALIVEFFVKPLLSAEKTFLNGRQTYQDVEHIRISVPADKWTRVEEVVRQDHITRFPLDYKLFKQGQKDVMVGTPIALWPQVGPSQALQLDQMGIRTIEQFLSVSDDNGVSIAGFYELKKQAQQYLDQANNAAASSALQKQLDEAKKKSDDEIALLRAELAEIKATQQAPKRFGKPITPKQPKE